MPNPSNPSILATSFSPVCAPCSPARPARNFRIFLFTLIALTGALSAWEPSYGQAAQPAPGGAVPAFSMADLRPALANVQNAITAANVGRWKVSSEARGNAQQDIGSMQRDLSTTLPGLMTTAESASGGNGSTPLAPAFAVFRNLDALYDVLLRVTEAAATGAPEFDAKNLEAARASLESGRARLGAWLLQAITAQDAQLTQAANMAARPPAAPAPPSKIIVEDGPQNPKPRKKKAAAPPAPQ